MDMEDFRGLDSVVQAWRGLHLCDRRGLRVHGYGSLADVLDMADQYMADVESQEPVNLAGPVSPEPGEDAEEFHEAGTIESIEAWQNAGREVAPEDGYSLTGGAYLPTRGAMEGRGLFGKYQVARKDNTDLPGGKHYGCPLFVLDIRHDRHARVAARRYAQSCQHDEPRLSDDLMVLVTSETGIPASPQSDLVDVGVGVEVFSPNLAPLPRINEQHCGNTDPHQGHDWAVRGIPGHPLDVWCPGGKD